MIAADQETGPTPVERSVSIGTWNMDHWKRTSQQRKDAWRYLQTESKADVMLLQESVAPSDIPRNRFVHREIAGRRPWGSSVVAFAHDLETEEIDAVRTRYGATRFSMLGSLPGSVIVARIHVPEVGPITCVSVYGAMDDVYAQTRMFRVIADLIPLFDSRDGRRVILGGDFNITMQLAPTTRLNCLDTEQSSSAIESSGSSILLPRQRIDRTRCRVVRAVRMTAAMSERSAATLAHSWIGCMLRRNSLAGARGCEWITPSWAP